MERSRWRHTGPNPHHSGARRGDLKCLCQCPLTAYSTAYSENASRSGNSAQRVSGVCNFLYSVSQPAAIMPSSLSLSHRMWSVWSYILHSQRETSYFRFCQTTFARQWTGDQLNNNKKKTFKREQRTFLHSRRCFSI